MKRTFGSMTNGSLRGNIFVMTISTIGSAFFFLPYYGKVNGLLTMVIIVAIPALVCYYSNYKLYYGFKHTNAKTYDECMKGILGPKLGYLSNVVLFLHTFNSVVGTWIFSLKIVSNFLMTVFGFEELFVTDVKFKIAYFGTVMLLVFVSTILIKMEKLKFISIIGIGIIMYMLIVFMYQCQEYYTYYKGDPGIDIVNFNITFDFFEAYGMCNYLFLNQYCIIPICNDVKQVTSKRISKIIARSTIFIFMIFMVVLFVGYFSLPNYDQFHDLNIDKLFLLRPAIDNEKDDLIKAGKILFAVYLLICMLVKGHFFLIYFNQLLNNTIKLIKGGVVNQLNADDVAEITPQERMTRRTLANAELKAKLGKPDTQVEIYIDPIEETCPDEEQIDGQLAEEKKPISYHVINLLFLTFMMVLTILVADSLNSFLSVAGGFVAIFEIIVFPLLMILAMDSNQKILGRIEKPVMVCCSVVLIGLGLTSTLITIYKKVTGP